MGKCPQRVFQNVAIIEPRWNLNMSFYRANILFKSLFNTDIFVKYKTLVSCAKENLFCLARMCRTELVLFNVSFKC